MVCFFVKVKVIQLPAKKTKIQIKNLMLTGLCWIRLTTNAESFYSGARLRKGWTALLYRRNNLVYFSYKYCRILWLVLAYDGLQQSSEWVFHAGGSRFSTVVGVGFPCWLESVFHAGCSCIAWQLACMRWMMQDSSLKYFFLFLYVFSDVRHWCQTSFSCSDYNYNSEE